jgi:hypothetical protein
MYVLHLGLAFCFLLSTIQQTKLNTYLQHYSAAISKMNLKSVVASEMSVMLIWIMKCDVNVGLCVCHRY